MPTNDEIYTENIIDWLTPGQYAEAFKRKIREQRNRQWHEEELLALQDSDIAQNENISLPSQDNCE
jgi:hypothetical protein